MNIVHRVRNMLLEPRREWSIIAGEAARPSAVVLHYIVPLVLLRAAASFLTHTTAGHPVFGIGAGLIGAVLQTLFVMLSALVLDLLAASFGAERGYPRALELAGYAGTPMYLGSALLYVPIAGEYLSFAGGMYGLYLLYAGLPVMMRVRSEKAGLYLLVAIVVLAVVTAVLFMILGYILTLTGLTGAQFWIP